MKKLMMALLCAGTIAGLTGCANIGGGTDLSDVAMDTGLDNITTGDGTFENYSATGHYSSTEVGIAVGIPFLCKIMELYPAQTNEDTLGHVATAAKNDGADAMINVTPHKEFYTGIPFIIVGVYVDKSKGTGIASNGM